MYDPPYKEVFAKAYDEGYQAKKEWKSIEDNPYESSGHERDTTFSDELHYWWYAGYSAMEDEIWEGSTCATCHEAKVINGQMLPHADNCPYK